MDALTVRFVWREVAVTDSSPSTFNREQRESLRGVLDDPIHGTLQYRMTWFPSKRTGISMMCGLLPRVKGLLIESTSDKPLQRAFPTQGRQSWRIQIRIYFKTMNGYLWFLNQFTRVSPMSPAKKAATRPSLGSQRSQPSTVVKDLLLVPRDSYGVFTFMFSQKFSPNREGIELSTVVCMSSECVSYYGRMFTKCEFIDSTRSTDTGGVLEYGAHYPYLHDSYQTPFHMCRA